MTTIGFYLSGVIAVGIIFIGCRFLLAPSTAAVAYGVAVNDGWNRLHEQSLKWESPALGRGVTFRSAA